MMNENMSELLGGVEREVEARIAKWERDRTKQLLKAFETGARKHVVMMWLQDNSQGMTTQICLDPVLMNLIGATAGKEAERTLKKKIGVACAKASEEIIRAIAEAVDMDIEITGGFAEEETDDR